jgi:hypothetical protein
MNGAQLLKAHNDSLGLMSGPPAEACAEYDSMRDALSALLETEQEGGPEGSRSFLDGVAAFVGTDP